MRQLLLLTILLMMFSSCKQDDQIQFENENIDGVPSSFSLEISDMLLDGSASLPALSKAPVLPLEKDEVENLWVLQFDANNNLAIEPTYISAITETSFPPYKIKVVLRDGENQTVYFVANTFDRKLYGDLKVGETLKETIDAKTFAVDKIPPGYMPMFGSLKDITIKGATYPTISNPDLDGKVTLTRLYAKVKLSLNIPTTSLVPPTEYIIGKKTLVITKIYLMNTSERVKIISEQNVTHAAAIPLPLENDRIDIDITPISFVETDYYGTSTQEITFYMPQNIAGVVAPFDTPKTTGSTFVNSFKASLNKFGDFDGDGYCDPSTTSISPTPSYIKLKGTYKYPLGMGQEDRTDNIEIRIYLGNFLTDNTNSANYKLYNNYNINANHYYKIKATIQSISKIDKRIILTPTI